MTPPRDGPAPQQAYIGAVIVTFNPDPRRLLEVVNAVARQVGEIIVVDNGSAMHPESLLGGLSPNPLALIALGDNYGIACAQNIGLARARERGCTHALVLDHDAVASPGMVAGLLAEMRAREARGERVAAVGPLINDTRRAAPAPFFRIGTLRVKRVDAADPGEVSARVDFLISAGALFSLAAAREIGVMREALFIDYVDLEWSLRAQSLGYRLYGHCGVSINHRLGDEPLTIFGRAMTAHSPLRHYYLVRNALALWRLPYTPWNWKIADALHLARKFIVFSTLAPRRFSHFRMMLRGLADGFAGRYGREDQASRDWQVPDAVRSTRVRQLAPAGPNTTTLVIPE
jgi:rhamnosyltransferase